MGCAHPIGEVRHHTRYASLARKNTNDLESISHKRWEDRGFFYQHNDHITVIGVFDGHGKKSHLVSSFVTKMALEGMQQIITEVDPQLEDFTEDDHHWLNEEAQTYMKTKMEELLVNIHKSYLQESFEIKGHKLRELFFDGGCTATLCFVYSSTIIISYMGDSPAVAFQITDATPPNPNEPLIFNLTAPHDRHNTVEMERVNRLIESSKTKDQKVSVMDSYIELDGIPLDDGRYTSSGLQMTRSIGDNWMKGVGKDGFPFMDENDAPGMAVPETVIANINHLYPTVLIISSDGFLMDIPKSGAHLPMIQFPDDRYNQMYYKQDQLYEMLHQSYTIGFPSFIESVLSNFRDLLVREMGNGYMDDMIAFGLLIAGNNDPPPVEMDQVRRVDVWDTPDGAHSVYHMPVATVLHQTTSPPSSPPDTPISPAPSYNPEEIDIELEEEAVQDNS